MVFLLVMVSISVKASEKSRYFARSQQVLFWVVQNSDVKRNMMLNVFF